MTYSRYSKTNLLFEHLELLNCFLLRSYLWLLCVYHVGGKAGAAMHICGGQMRALRCYFFPSTVGSGDSDSDLQAFATNAFTHCAIL